MTFYAEMIELAEEMLTEFGQPLTLTRVANAGGFDDAGNPIAPSAPVSVTGQGVKLDYEIDEIDGETVRTGDAKLLWVGGEPLTGMTGTIDGEVWRVVSVGKLQPGGTLVFYPNVQLRK